MAENVISKSLLKTVKWIAALIVLCVVTGLIWWKTFGEHHVERSRESEMQVNMASLMEVEEAYYEEYGEYSDDFEELGYVPEGNVRANFYLSKDEIPAEVRANISEGDMPFVKKDDYQILAIYKEISGKETYWKQRKGGRLEKIEVIRSH